MATEEQTMEGPPGPALDALWQKDVHKPGKATCPKCGALRGYGTSGVMNLVGTHLNKEGCREAAEKKDKQLKNGSLKSFFTKKTAPIAKFVKSAVRAPLPIHGTGVSTPRVAPAAASGAESSHGGASRGVELLPSTVPVATQDNPLSEFAGQPTEYVSQSTPPGELWEELAPHFHRVFGYGMELEERKRMIQRGSAGLDGAVRFLDYFIRERGLEGGMVEAKIEQLIEAVQTDVLNNLPVLTRIILHHSPVLRSTRKRKETRRKCKQLLRLAYAAPLQLLKTTLTFPTWFGAKMKVAKHNGITSAVLSRETLEGIGFVMHVSPLVFVLRRSVVGRENIVAGSFSVHLALLEDPTGKLRRSWSKSVRARVP
ncbi:hypothetical protein B0H16DRAFT_1793815 [Mycena metata]|uniref:Uncharacterized protein n=1 Tax=Mycena metata TaxID=1033252 RepID=A0AAD7HGM9_9AGAR|nr:hypothetical protein B0H16DRAFT_1793815 [Mycena metata]